MKIGDKIKERRLQLNLSQDDLSKKLGYKSRSSINKIELGLTDISQTKIIEFANALNTSPAYLMGWDDDVESKSNTTSLPKNTCLVHVYSRLSKKISLISSNDCIGYVIVPEKLSRKKELFGLKMIDDSMNRVIPKGSVGIFQKCDTVNVGDIAAILVNDEDAVIRHYTKTFTGYILEPDSYDANHDIRMLSENDDISVKVIGKLVWHCMDPNDIK